LDDLPILTEHFLEKHRQGLGKATIHPEARRLLYAHSWPGNIRELENVIERGLVLAQGEEIKPEDLPEELRRPEFLAGSLNAVMAQDADSPSLDPSLAKTPAGALEPYSDFIGEVMAALPAGIALAEAMDALEEGLIRRALAMGDGVQSRAAELLGLKRNVFKYKWDKFSGLEPTPLAMALAEKAPPETDLVMALEDLEKELLRRALAQSQGALGRAAELLGLKKNLMTYKLKKYPNLD
jgi:two-component system NtrC family response regulator